MSIATASDPEIAPARPLLGRIFSPWNVLAYGVGILLGMQLDRFARIRS